jgi:hypothetical protein
MELESVGVQAVEAVWLRPRLPEEAQQVRRSLALAAMFLL